jgi:hypothetical protein
MNDTILTILAAICGAIVGNVLGFIIFKRKEL